MSNGRNNAALLDSLELLHLFRHPFSLELSNPKVICRLSAINADQNSLAAGEAFMDMQVSLLKGSSIVM
jgi:hypothetical protein